MAVTTQVRVHDGTNWQAISNVSDIRLRRRVGGSEASFRVYDASIAQRNLVRTGRECEVVITVDGNRKVFGGYIDKPRLQAVAPNSFNISPRVVDLSHGAAIQNTAPIYADADEKYTDLVSIYWSIHWNDVDTSGVTDHPTTHPERISPGFDSLASFTDEIVKRYLPDWVWWVGHNGTGANGILKKLFVQPRGHQDRTSDITITENDINIPFDVQPIVDPRNYILVAGDDDPSGSSTWPVRAVVEDANSQAAYGRRELATKESEVADTGALRNIGIALLEQRKFDLMQGRFKVYNWVLEPGDKISLYLPTIGFNNGAAGVPWVVMEVEEQVNQGKVERWATLMEHNDAAFVRVS